MALVTRNLIIDTHYFISKSFDFSSAELMSLRELAEKEVVNVFITDITEREIRKKINDEIKTAFGRLSISDLRYLHKIPLFAQFLESYNEKKAIQHFLDQFELFKNKAKVNVISSDEICFIDVFEDYCNSQPPFNLKKKKNEFPDAFAIAAISKWGIKTSHKAYLLSGDPDWTSFCEQSSVNGLSEEYRFLHIEELPEFIDLVYRTEESLKDVSLFADNLIHQNISEIEKQVLTKIQGVDFFADSPDDEDITETYMLAAFIENKEIIAADRQSAIFKIDFRIEGIFKFLVPNYDNSVYDSDEKEFIFLEQNEFFHKQDFEIHLEIEITYRDGLASNFQIKSILVPSMINVPYDPEDVIDIDEWARELPVIVSGVAEGRITDSGLGIMEFENLEEAQKTFPSLQLKNPSSEFTKALGNRITEKIRFQTWKASQLYSS